MSEKKVKADDCLLFIDANKYLDLYRTNSGKKLLAILLEQKEHIFVTKQVCAEVQRNKISVAIKFLKEKYKGLQKQNLSLSDHLFATQNDLRDDIQERIKNIGQEIKSVNSDVDNLVLGLVEEISNSEDEVSKALPAIFANAIPHTSEELKKARLRKELGNPPGKKNDPIGDELTWEQILTHFQGKKRLWIISRDDDYSSYYGEKRFLNGLLYDELKNISSDPEVYLFEDILKGINHFIETTGVEAEETLTPEEVQEIEREENSLSCFTINPELIRQMEELVRPKVNPELIRQMEELVRPKVNPELIRQMEELARPKINPELVRQMEELARPKINPEIFDKKNDLEND